MKKDTSLDIDRKQSLKDIFRRNQFAIDDRFVIRDGKKHKCAILCPGGGYYMVCSFIEGVPIAKKLNEMGISAFIVYYRVKKKAHYPNPQEDLAKAVEYVFQNQEEYNLDMRDYSIWGSSAGGHLVGSFGTSLMGYKKYNLPKPKCLVLSYPVISLEKELTHEGTRDLHIGQEATKEEELKYSVYTNVDCDYPSTYIWCGDADKTVPPVNTELMAKVLQNNKIMYKKEVFKNVEHGVGPATGTAAQNWIKNAVDFWLE